MQYGLMHAAHRAGRVTVTVVGVAPQQVFSWPGPSDGRARPPKPRAGALDRHAGGLEECKLLEMRRFSVATGTTVVVQTGSSKCWDELTLRCIYMGTSVRDMQGVEGGCKILGKIRRVKAGTSARDDAVRRLQVQEPKASEFGSPPATNLLYVRRLICASMRLVRWDYKSAIPVNLNAVAFCRPFNLNAVVRQTIQDIPPFMTDHCL
ncbi:hypothetical protein V8E52_009286 [Russula decolorans]